MVPRFIDPEKGAQHYLDRYYGEPDYKAWFDRNFPGYTIEEAIELATKKSNFWYILPIVFGIVGGIIAAAIIRNSDPKKSLICAIIGIGITGLWIGIIFASTDQPDSFVPTEEEIAAQIRMEQANERIMQTIQENEERQQRLLERQEEQRLLERQEEQKLEQQEEQKLEPKPIIIIEYNQVIVQSAIKSIPAMQSLPKEVLKKCKEVESFYDYQTFLLEVAVMDKQLIKTISNIDTSLTFLELKGYDQHPEVGPLIMETRSLATETGNCIDELLSKYGS